MKQGISDVMEEKKYTDITVEDYVLYKEKNYPEGDIYEGPCARYESEVYLLEHARSADVATRLISLITSLVAKVKHGKLLRIRIYEGPLLKAQYQNYSFRAYKAIWWMHTSPGLPLALATIAAVLMAAGFFLIAIRVKPEVWEKVATGVPFTFKWIAIAMGLGIVAQAIRR